MELQFMKHTTEYVSQLFCDQISQEETAETIVPDSYPDVERIIDCTAQVTLRNKDSQQVSGAITATVLYAPDDYGDPKTLSYYIPFTIHGNGANATDLLVDCNVQSADARMLNSRKVMVRVHLTGTVKGYGTQVEERSTYAPQPQEDLELLTNTYTLVRPVEVGEKAFTVSDQVDMPQGTPEIDQVYHSQVTCQITESKLLGTKGVFKGNLTAKIIYQGQNAIHTFTCDLPFSQYVDLNRDYDQEELQVVPMMTDCHIDVIGTGSLLVSVQLLAQCLVMGQEVLEVVEDGYSLGHQFTPQWSNMTPTSRLDVQTFQQVTRTNLPCPAKEVVYTHGQLGYPMVKQGETQREIMVPVHCTVVYRDQQGELQSYNTLVQTTFETEMWPDCLCRPTAYLTGEPYALLSGDGLELRCPLGLSAETWSVQHLQTLCGGELGAPLDKSSYPSVMLRPVTAQDTLWSVAKGCRTTMEAIRQTNQVSDLSQFQSKILLIPIAK